MSLISEVYNMDCVDGMKQYPDKFFDLAVVDKDYFYVGNKRFKESIKQQSLFATNG